MSHPTGTSDEDRNRTQRYGSASFPAEGEVPPSVESTELASAADRTRTLPEDVLAQDPSAETLDHVTPPENPSSILPTRTVPASSGQLPDRGSVRPDISGGWGTIGSDGKLEPGQVVFGRYLVKKELGRGGMGTVWLVRHVTLDTDRALKLIVANIAFDPQARGRFRREAQAMARFTHPNAVTVHDALLTNDVAFIEMELVPGKSLAELFPRGTAVPVPLVGRILRQLCDVLQVAHEHGIVHRDLKPSNLMLLGGRPEGREFLKVLDFGIAKILGADDPAGDVHTITNAFMGTPPYTSPEQANGKADPRSDIYSAGVMLYEFLTGHRPFSGSVAKQISDTLHTPPPPFHKVNPNVQVPAEVEALVLRCLAKDPAARPQTPRELAELFEAALPESMRDRPSTLLSPPIAPPRRPPMAAILAGVVAIALGAFGLSRLIGGGRSGTNGTTANSSQSGGNGTTKPELPPLKLPKDITAEPIGDGVTPPVLIFRGGPRFRYIPGGSFLMNAYSRSDKPPPQPFDVTVASFYLAETEVTNGEFNRYLQDKGAAPPEDWEKAYNALIEQVGTTEADEHPAIGIDHATAEAYASWLGGRLPKSAEWEYAAQSGGQPEHKYVWGMTPDVELGTDRAKIDTRDRPDAPTAPVRSFRLDQTAQSIFDLTGNVREWCADPSQGQQARPGEPQHFVVRGGSWNSNADLFTTSAHDDVPGPEHLPDLGFRVALDVPESLAARLPQP
jgi:serine/threonine protein kinase